MSIKESLEKIKGGARGALPAWRPEALLERNTFVGLLLGLVALSSFAFGRLSGMEEGRVPVRITFPGAATSSLATAGISLTQTPPIPKPDVTGATKGQYVASKSGTKYHLPWCSGAKRISEENKIWFASKAEAEKAGYTPAANCKGI